MFIIMINFRDHTRETVEFRCPTFDAYKVESGVLLVNIFPKDSRQPNGIVMYPMDLIASVTIVKIEE